MLVRSGWREIAPDLDGNGIPDTVCMVEDGGEEQTVAFGGEVELGFVNLGVRIANLLVAEESFLNDAWIRIAAELVNDDNRDVKEEQSAFHLQKCSSKHPGADWWPSCEPPVLFPLYDVSMVRLASWRFPLLCRIIKSQRCFWLHSGQTSMRRQRSRDELL